MASLAHDAVHDGVRDPVHGQVVAEARAIEAPERTLGGRVDDTRSDAGPATARRATLRPVKASLPRRLAMSAAVLLGFLLAAELLARVALDDADLVMNPALAAFRDHPTALFTYRPHVDVPCPPQYRDCPVVRTNALGLRDVERTVDKPAGTLRVLSLGESTAAGALVRIEEAYPARVEAALRENGLQVEVINAGVEAYTSWQVYAWLEAEGMAFQPDVVMTYVEGNDRQPTGVVDRHQFHYRVSGTDRQLWERRRRIAPLLRLLYRSHAFRFARKQVLRLPSDLPDAREAGMRPTGGVRVPLEDRREAFTRMAALCEGRCRLVVLQPSWQGRRPEPHLRTLAADVGAVYIDLSRVTRESGLGPRFWLDGIHPTPEGHQRYADAIAPVLAGLLE